jgi:hypothetical protein
MFKINHYWLYICIIYSCLSLSAHPNCPATSIINFEDNLFYNYPVSYFSDVSEYANAQVYNCSTLWDNATTATMQKIEPCISGHACPVKHKYIKTVLGVQKWSSNSYKLCEMTYFGHQSKWLSSISNNSTSSYSNTINLIFFGGSMTLGVGTVEACCCHNAIDKRCPATHSCPHMYNVKGQNDFYCGWVGYFVRWFKLQFPKKTVTYKNYAISGATSRFMADRLGNEISEVVDGIGVVSRHTFSENDIVFLDHSVNDAVQEHTKKLVGIRIGIESLIRRIYHYSTTKPLLIILEQFPHMTISRDTIPTLTSPFDYAFAYREIAKHYGLMLWSYRELVWSDVLDRNLFLKLSQYGVHPPWYAQMFIADIFSSCLMTVLKKQCNTNSYRNRENHQKSQTENTSLNKQDGSNLTFDLPPVLYNLSHYEKSMCDYSYPVLTHVHANSTFTPSNITLYEMNVNNEIHGWTEYDDHHGAPGFIITNKFVNSSSNLTDLERILTFPLKYPSDDFNFANVSNNYVLKVTYLRTYENAGKVQVFLCNLKIHRFAMHNMMDGLWRDYKDYKYSTREIHINDIQGYIAHACDKLSPNDRKLEFRYILQNDIYEKAIIPERKNEKFKIYEVEICHTASPS